MIDRRYEPHIELDRATEATRRRAETAPLPMPDSAPPPNPELPHEDAWARSAPSHVESYGAPAGYRSSAAWLTLTFLAIGGSAAYLAYAAIVAPDAPARPVATASIAAQPDPLSSERALERPVAEPPVVAPPPMPPAPPDPAPPPDPAVAPDQTVAPVAWIMPPPAERPQPSHRRPAKPAQARKPADGPLTRLIRDMRHSLSRVFN